MYHHHSNINSLVKSINLIAQSLSKLSCDYVAGQVVSIDGRALEIEGLARFVKRGQGIRHERSGENLTVTSLNKDTTAAKTPGHWPLRIGDPVALKPSPLFCVHDSWMGTQVYDTGTPVEENTVLQGKPYGASDISIPGNPSTAVLTTGFGLIDAVFPMQRGGTYLLQACDRLIMRELRAQLAAGLQNEMVVHGASSAKAEGFSVRSITIVPTRPARGTFPQSCLEAVYSCAGALRDQGYSPLVICEGRMEWEQLEWLEAHRSNTTTLILSEELSDGIAQHEAIDECYRIALDIHNGETLRWLEIDKMKLPSAEQTLLDRLVVARSLLRLSQGSHSLAQLGDLKRTLKLDQETDAEQFSAALLSLSFER